MKDVFTNRHGKTVPIVKTKRDKFKRTIWIKSLKRAEGETDLETFVYFDNVEIEAEQGVRETNHTTHRAINSEGIQTRASTYYTRLNYALGVLKDNRIDLEQEDVSVNTHVFINRHAHQTIPNTQDPEHTSM